MPEPNPSPDSGARLIAAASITAAAIQTGKVNADDLDCVAGYFASVHQRLFGSLPKMK